MEDRERGSDVASSKANVIRRVVTLAYKAVLEAQFLNVLGLRGMVERFVEGMESP